MDNFKGTPGPWSHEADSSNGITIESEGIDVACIIADNEDDLLSDLEWDNARLIAAAPDLLEACQEAMKELRFHDWANTTTGFKIQIAIDKALGKEVSNGKS